MFLFSSRKKVGTFLVVAPFYFQQKSLIINKLINHSLLYFSSPLSDSFSLFSPLRWVSSQVIALSCSEFPAVNRFSVWSIIEHILNNQIIRMLCFNLSCICFFFCHFQSLKLRTRLSCVQLRFPRLVRWNLSFCTSAMRKMFPMNSGMPRNNPPIP